MTVELVQLQKQLNHEYALVGKITIFDGYKDMIPTNTIAFKNIIMKEVLTSFKSVKPIVVRPYNSHYKYKYKLIDGYHRLKYCIENKISTIPSYVLTKYEIGYVNDEFYTFIQKLIGKTITFLNDYIIQVDKQRYYIEPNEGCGGCSNGWSSIEFKPQYTNVSITIESVSKNRIDADVYDLVLNNEIVARVNTGWGNGFYGGDFKVLKI